MVCWRPTHGRATEPCASLSIGTREQLWISRQLAFAVHPREKGYPAPLVLDDALVFADPSRFERVRHALLRQAVQILILTCREEAWRPAGMPILRLANATTFETGGQSDGAPSRQERNLRSLSLRHSATFYIL